MNGEEYAAYMRAALEMLDSSRDRTVLSKSHHLGVSDVGGCPQYAVLMIRQTEFTDAPDSTKAQIGTALHRLYEDARRNLDPDLLVGHTVKIRLSNGVELEGHPDVTDLDEGSVTDDKTSDGLGLVRRNGPTRQQVIQVHLYALGEIQAGRLTPECIVRLVFWDRSGREPEPYVWQQQFDPEVITEATEWLDDVLYAVKNGEDAQRTPPLDWCRVACPFYSACRLPALPEVEDFITDEPTMQAIDTYVEGKRLSKQADSMVRSSKEALEGIAGVTTTGYRVRWVSIPQSGDRFAYRRIDVRKVTA
jgi:hypothetical protein